jgi:SpoVK/Ycf46/Vps4 family AAA+-type ATPase
MLRKGRWDELFFVDLPNQAERVETAVEKCGGVMCVTGRSKTAASSITMKDVRRYGKLERDTQASIG